MTRTSCAIALLLLFVLSAESWNDGGSVLLRDLQVLTLYKGRYTTARRTSPVPQLQCVGGSAGCSAFVPEVVQCQNKGWDGVDVQWECKTDMDYSYRFGRIEVSCEGFNHPDDSYILKGSCGLEYTLELTESGKQRGKGSQGSGGFGGFASSFFQGASDNSRQGGNPHPQSSSGGDGGGLIVVGLFLLLAYGVYKMFLCNPVHGQDRFPNDGFQGPNPHGHPNNMGPPPPGFKPDYAGSSPDFGSQSSYPGSSSGYGFRNEFTRQQTGQYPGQSFNSGTGFWSGMGTGGILGYLFGSQRRQPTMPTMPNANSWTSDTRKPPESTGTRTASGFGGTKRR